MYNKPRIFLPNVGAQVHWNILVCLRLHMDMLNCDDTSNRSFDENREGLKDGDAVEREERALSPGRKPDGPQEHFELVWSYLKQKSENQPCVVLFRKSS